jgi:hypothetical protein
MERGYSHAFSALSQYVREHLGRSDFASLVKNKQFLSHQIRVMNFPSSTALLLNFPGPLSTTSERGSLVDFQVEFLFQGGVVPLSAVDLVIDLVSKLRRRGISVEHARELLRFVRDGRTPDASPFIRKSIPTALQTARRRVQRRIGDTTTERQLTPELTPEEMASAMVFLLLRDELLDPRPAGVGRQPTLDRFAEALHVAIRAPQLLESALERAMSSHHSIARWPDCDYSFVHIPDGQRPTRQTASSSPSPIIPRRGEAHLFSPEKR